MSVFVGLDCGGSSSRVLALDEVGNVLFQGQSGAANLVSTPEGRLRRNLEHATKDCPTPDFVCGCFAGLINETMRERGVNILRDTFGDAPKFRAEPDYTAALFTAPEADICVISGTGSLVCSQANGVISKSGGRGYILGDEGSGYYFGRDALLHYIHHPNLASDSLKKSIEEIFGSLEETVIISGVYKAPTPATILARLAKAVGHDAKDGAEYALESIRTNMEELALVVISHVIKHHSTAESLTISLSGGVWKAGALFRDTFVERLVTHRPQVDWNVVRLSKPPLHGAVELARQMTA
jgi:N-acetylglucosamine kinase-like BadF-type ATPase